MANRKRMSGPHFFERDASYLHLVKAGLIECGATALFLFFTIGTITSGCRASSNAAVSGNSAGLAGVAPGACALQVPNITNIALAFGISIFVLVYATAAYTGGHLNPAVSLGLVVAGRISFVRGIVYTVCQVLGATVGAALVRAVDPLAFAAIGGGANKLATEVTYAQAWGMEAILTFSLVMMVFAATDNFHAAKVSHLPVLAPLAIGMTVFVCHLVAVPIDGCSINPARSFGPALAANRWHHQWVFWVGPYAGAIVAALIYELAFRDHTAVPEKKAMDIEEGDEKVPSVPSVASGKFPHITSGPEAGKAMPAQA